MFITGFVICLICQGISVRMRSFLVLRSELRESQDFHKKAESLLGRAARFCLGSRKLGLTFSREKILTEILPCWGWVGEVNLSTCLFLI